MAALARLRRGIGHRAHTAPGTWGIDGLEELARLREKRRIEADAQEEAGALPRVVPSDERHTSDRKKTAEEEAVHLAVTLWALHQQSIRDANMHAAAWSLGRAVRRLAQVKPGTADPVSTDGTTATADRGDRKSGPRSDDELNEAIRKRFVRIGTAHSFDSLAVRLREMVVLLRNARIPLDYGRLADQLCSWQDPRRRGEVCRAWGRELHLSFAEGSRSGTPERGLAGTELPSFSADERGDPEEDTFDVGE
ncbi:type I-E CRISPR-associated protein Cse2/CasB (plasmid) [Streptomyces sp. HU2014]|nr:type I-E CRISPR-associated protein Cse2/CasB [Streptomyces sp. HU2014]UQI49719.1 type I-E CRISPR-associated protein Cse2/CasB [Streptomyces sp. HU2014]